MVENLKELYDKIPDITKTEIIKETEEWSTSVPSTEKVLQVIPAYIYTKKGKRSADNK